MTRFRLIIGEAIVLALLLIGLTYARAEAHDTVIVACSNNKQVKLVNEIVLPNDLYAEFYDTNGDGKPDIQTLSAIHDKKLVNGAVVIEHAKFPTFYVVDLDGETDEKGNQHAELIYIDKGNAGLGVCSDVVLYMDLREPQTPNAAEPKGNTATL